MAAWLNPGTARSPSICSAQRKPRASEMEMRTGSGVTAAAEMIASCSSTLRLGLLPESLLEPLLQCLSVGLILEGHVHAGADVAARVTEVVTLALVDDDVHRVSLGDHQLDGIGDLNF